MLSDVPLLVPNIWRFNDPKLNFYYDLKVSHILSAAFSKTLYKGFYKLFVRCDRSGTPTINRYSIFKFLCHKF